MNRYFIVIGLLVSLSSCQKEIDFELNDDDNLRLVVEGVITNQKKQHLVSLTRTGSYYQNEPALRETGASVRISDGTLTYTLTEVSPGSYLTDSIQGEIGKTYTLQIVTTGNEVYSATSKLTAVAAIDSITYEYVDQLGRGGVDEIGLELRHWGQETVGVGNAYMWLVYIDDNLDSRRLVDITFVNDDLVDGNYIKDFGCYIIDEETLSQHTVPPLDVVVEMHSISTDYYDFLLSILLETEFKGGLFDGPSANVNSNVNNGALGWFRASAVSSLQLDVTL